MDYTKIHSSKSRGSFWLIGALAILTALATFAFPYISGKFTPRNRQEEVAARDAQVMPFDQEQTLPGRSQIAVTRYHRAANSRTSRQRARNTACTSSKSRERIS